MAVIVQAMVQSDSAGVAFSVHPITQNKNQVVIEAVKGLGDKLVSGIATPDQYVVDKQKNDIIQRHPVAKKPILPDQKVLELADTVIKIEAHCGFPVDVEWMLYKGKFIPNQSRPITTLK